ncbi:hypothetical protein [Ferrimonas pelagia]|uniref:DUF1570 domain-containing protein n=1 Tax=Ferrimonas pelagia TaxID=1177826 RepID=A0ABP9FLY4_9GAMM
MRWLSALMLLCGCAGGSSAPAPPELPVHPSALRFTQALNQADLTYLQSIFQPAHPLAEVDPAFAVDPGWQVLADEWLADLLMHAQDGDWQLRKPLAVSEDGSFRLQYRLVHADFSVEYFYFDARFTASSVRLEDMGNRLFQLSQVGLMEELYHRMMLGHTRSSADFSSFFSQIGPLNRGEIGPEPLLESYTDMPDWLQQNVLPRDLMLRSLMAYGQSWYAELSPGTKQRLLGSDYPLLETTLCLQLPDRNCGAHFSRLPLALRQDVALQAEMGIRALQRGDTTEARGFAQMALISGIDYFPAYWLQMQLGILLGDYTGALAGLDSMVQHFDVPISKSMLTQMYPDQGQQFLRSADFRRWAEQFPQE